jgi:hypothetical protein
MNCKILKNIAASGNTFFYNFLGDADGVPQEDFELVEYVRRNYLIAPAPNETEYALSATKTIIDPSLGSKQKNKIGLKKYGKHLF